MRSAISQQRQQLIDDLARGLGNGTISRRRVLVVVGAAALGAAVVPHQLTEAKTLSRRFRRRCRRKGGIPLEKGSCHCAFQSGADVDAFNCAGSPDCACFEDAEGRGFCGSTTLNFGCTENSDCQPDERCAQNLSVAPSCTPVCT